MRRGEAHWHDGRARRGQAARVLEFGHWRHAFDAGLLARGTAGMCRVLAPCAASGSDADGCVNDVSVCWFAGRWCWRWDFGCWGRPSPNPLPQGEGESGGPSACGCSSSRRSGLLLATMKATSFGSGGEKSQLGVSCRGRGWRRLHPRQGSEAWGSDHGCTQITACQTRCAEARSLLLRAFRHPRRSVAETLWAGL